MKVGTNGARSLSKWPRGDEIAAVDGAPRFARLSSAVRIARRNWGMTAAVLFLLCLGVFAAFPSLFGVPDPLLTTPRDAFKGPSRHYLFGTDDLGRDLFSRTIYGARVSLGTAIAVVAWLALAGSVLLAVGVGLERAGTSPLEAGQRVVDVLTTDFS